MNQGGADGAPSSRRGDPVSDIIFISGGALAPTVRERLVRALGERRAAEVFRQASAQFGDCLIDAPQDMLDFSELLIRAGGLVQSVGHSLKVQALLRGAVE